MVKLYLVCTLTVDKQFISLITNYHITLILHTSEHTHTYILYYDNALATLCLCTCTHSVCVQSSYQDIISKQKKNMHPVYKYKYTDTNCHTRSHKGLNLTLYIEQIM